MMAQLNTIYSASQTKHINNIFNIIISKYPLTMTLPLRHVISAARGTKADECVVKLATLTGA